MRMRGTIAPKTPSKTMPSRTPMMIVLVMSRFLVEERREESVDLGAPWFSSTTIDSSKRHTVRRASRDPSIRGYASRDGPRVGCGPRVS